MRGISTVSVLALFCAMALPVLAEDAADPVKTEPVPFLVKDKNAAKGEPIPAMAMPSAPDTVMSDIFGKKKPDPAAAPLAPPPVAAPPAEKKGFLSGLFGGKSAAPSPMVAPLANEPTKAFATVREGSDALWTITAMPAPMGGNTQCMASRSATVDTSPGVALPVSMQQGLTVSAVRIHNANAMAPMVPDTLQFNLFSSQMPKENGDGLLVGGASSMRVVSQTYTRGMNGEVTDIDALKKKLAGGGDAVFKLSGDTLASPATTMRDVVVKLDDCVAKGAK